MAGVTLDFAGQARMFHLRLGEILDLEQACGQTGIGAIYRRLGQQDWKIRDVREVLAYALRGGGMPLDEARRLIDERIEVGRILDLYSLALEVMITLMAGVEPDPKEAAGDPTRCVDSGAIFASFAQMGIAPETVRAMRYDDFVLMARAMSGDRVKPPSEDEFRDMVARYEARHGKIKGSPV